jgi:hypothetical protein
VTFQKSNKSFSKISKQVPAIGNLHCFGSAFARALDVEVTSVATHYLDTGV